MTKKMTIRPVRILAPIAACLIVALAVSIPMLINNGGGNPINNGDHSISSVSPTTVTVQTDGSNTPTDGEQSADAPIDALPTVIAINEVAMIDNHIDIARQKLALHREDFIPMSKNEIIDFYGLSFFPDAIPSDLAEVEESAYGIYRRNGGTGEVYYSSNMAWYVDASVTRELSVEIAKGEVPFTDSLHIGNDYEKSIINGIELVIKHRVDDKWGTEYYVAEMMCEGNGIRVYSRNLTHSEFIGAVTSLLQGVANGN